MRKPLFTVAAIFTCALLLLSANAARAQGHDLITAIQLTENYFAAVGKGDAKALLKLMTKSNADEFKQQIAAIPSMLKTQALLMQKSEYEIVSARKDSVDDEIEVKVNLNLPYLPALFKGGPEISRGSFATEYAYLESWSKAAYELLKKAEAPEMDEERMTIVIIKENGAWKIDEEY